MELAGLGKVVPRILRKFKGGRVADSSGWPFALIFIQQIPGRQGTYQRRGKGEVSGRFRKLKV